tara:strand:- start:4280 stop:4420 length:141 start_codon:yes stop_codon:yes gene_type:complete
MSKDNKNTKKQWQKPEVKKLGNAKDLVKNVNVTGGGDTEFSVLLPS